ncbi:MAG: WD40 repeat domain-containing protein [Cyanobacteria bacterium P01_A01_bin.84]
MTNYRQESFNQTYNQELNQSGYDSNQLLKNNYQLNYESKEEKELSILMMCQGLPPMTFGSILIWFGLLKSVDTKEFLIQCQNFLQNGVRVATKNLLIAASFTGAVASPLIRISPAMSAGVQIEPKDHYNISRNFYNPRLVYTFKGHSGTVKSLAFGPNGKFLASGGADNDGIIRLWHLKKGKRIGIIRKAHKTAVLSLIISPDGKTLASCSNDYTINLWSLENRKFQRSFVGHSSNVLSLAMSSDSRVLASGGLDGIRLWDIQQQRPLGTLTRFGNSIYSVAMSPDNKILASGDRKGIVKLWNLKTGKLIRTFLGHRNSVSSLAFTPNGETLVTAGKDRKIKLWNLQTPGQFQVLNGHESAISAIAINPNGKILASGGKDGIKLWNLNTGSLISNLGGHSDWVTSVAWGPEGKMLASGGFDKTVKVWESE